MILKIAKLLVLQRNTAPYLRANVCSLCVRSLHFLKRIVCKLYICYLHCVGMPRCHAHMPLNTLCVIASNQHHTIQQGGSAQQLLLFAEVCMHRSALMSPFEAVVQQKQTLKCTNAD
jgi:hypothetical protein